MYNLEKPRSLLLSLRKITLLSTWLYAWLRLPNYQAEMITAAGGAIFIYLTLQLSIASGKLGQQ